MPLLPQPGIYRRGAYQPEQILSILRFASRSVHLWAATEKSVGSQSLPTAGDPCVGEPTSVVDRRATNIKPCMRLWDVVNHTPGNVLRMLGGSHISWNNIYHENGLRASM